MAKNASLNKANRARQDEFYTQIADIERELRHYTEHFRGKTIFCNCDDPEESNFWKYFALNFYQLGLKKLISTHYEESKPSYKLEIVAGETAQGQMKIPDVIKTPLRQNGDFRSPECVEILQEADIVITNPPFSLFKEYIAQLMEYEKKFIVIGSKNAITYKEVFRLLQENKMWLGYGFKAGNAYFAIPPEMASNYGENVYNPETGLVKFRNCGWYTNLDVAKRHEEITLYRTYSPEEYPTYVNYEAIEVSKVADIPCDYYGEMGVPITYLDIHNPEQFEIIGGSMWLGKPMSEIAPKGSYVAGGIRFYLNEPNSETAQIKYRRLYDRIVIRRRKQNED